MSREPITLVELVVPFCNLTHGQAPCTATGSPCYNTFATCQDRENYDRGNLSLFFSTGAIAERGVPGVTGMIRPFLKSVSTSPTRVNIAGLDPNKSGLGIRASTSVSMMDAPDPDRDVDPYQDQRSFDPLSRSSFWVKFRQRVRYVTGITIKIYEGYAGQALTEMQVRQYICEKLPPPDDAGNLTITGKDILSRLEERKAQVPEASPGLLFQAIDASQTSFIVAGALVSEYQASGTVRIGDELMTYSAVEDDPDGIRFTITQRGSDRTAAAEHDLDSVVQQCVRWDNLPPDVILRDLMVNYGGIPADFIPYAEWQKEVGDFISAVKLTHIVSQPIAVSELVSRVLQQTLLYAWWDERTAKINIQVLRGYTGELPVLSERDHLTGALQITDLERQRVSQAWVHFGVRDFTQSLTDAVNFRATFVSANPNSESDRQWGTPSVITIYANFLDVQVLARNLAVTINRRFVNVQQMASFTMDAKDRNFGVGDIVCLDVARVVDDDGAPRLRKWIITSYEPVHRSGLVRYEAMTADYLGRLYRIVANNTPDFTSGQALTDEAIIGDSAGLLSDGQQAARIA